MTGEPTWLDQVLAAPAIGITTAPWLGFASGIWDSLERLGDRWSMNTRITARGATGVRLERTNGTYLDLSPSNLVFGYSYQLHIEDRPGALPVLRSPDEARTYTRLLGDLLDDAAAVVADTLSSGTRPIVRIGVVADCRLVEDEAPPGIEELLRALSGVWAKPLKVVDANFVVEGRSEAATRDQCHHAVSKNAYDRPKDLRVKLDWQRVWTPQVRMNQSELHRQLKNAITTATDYFVMFGTEGGDLCRT